MIEWIENLFSENDSSKKITSPKHIDKNWEEFKQYVNELFNKLSKGDFKWTPIGQDVLALLTSLKERLNQQDSNGKLCDQNLLFQETKSLQSLTNAQTLEIRLYLTQLKKLLEQQKKYGFYNSEIDRCDKKIDKLLNNQNITFSDLCLEYTKFFNFYEKLVEKIQQKKTVKVEKPAIKSLSSEDHAKALKKEQEKNNLLKNTQALRKDIQTHLAYIENSPFKQLEIGITTIKELTNLNNKLLDEHLNFDTFTEHTLLQEKQGFQSYLISQTKELKDRLNKLIEQIKVTQERGFCLPDIEQWVKSANQLLKDDKMSFILFSDEYAKSYLAFEKLNSQIQEQARLKHAQLLKTRDDLELNLKLQTVQSHDFLTQREKQNFIDLSDSVEQAIKPITPENISEGDVEKIINSRDIPNTYASLIGPKSCSDKRIRFCKAFGEGLREKASILSKDKAEILLEHVQQTLISTGQAQLDISKESAHPYKRLADYAIRMNCGVRNLEHCFKAYEYFVLNHPLNFNHTKNGIEHARGVVTNAVKTFTEYFNAEFDQLLIQITEQEGKLTLDDLKTFSKKIDDAFFKWQRKTLVESATKSGFNPNSFNNYLKLWMDFSNKSKGETAFTSFWRFDQIHEEISKQKTSFNLTLFGNRGDQKFDSYVLKDWVDQVRDKFTQDEEIDRQETLFKFS